MAIAIQPYTEERVPAVRAFNQRLALGGVPREFLFPESSVPDWLPPAHGRRVFQRYLLAVEGDAVHGGFILKHQDFSIRGETRPVSYYHLPVSEGIVDKAYASVGVQMLRSALKMEPVLYCLGMGGFDRPLPQMLKAMGWGLCAVPFFFRVSRAAPFLRQIGPLQGSPAGRWAAELAAMSGLGWIGIHTLQRARTRRATRNVSSETCARFDDWADALWERCRRTYRLIGSRDAATLNVLYPPGGKFLRLTMRHGGQVLGWAVMLDTQMRDSKYFGNLRVGSIVDCLGAPEHAPVLMQEAARHLESRGVDLVVSNHSHRAWGTALRSAGFWEGPSNFIFAGSKAITALLAPFEENRHEMYWTRGDGDGPVNL